MIDESRDELDNNGTTITTAEENHGTIKALIAQNHVLRQQISDLATV